MYSFIYIQLSLLKCKFHEDIELVSIVWHCIAYCSGIHHVHSNSNCGVNKQMNLHVIIFQGLPLSFRPHQPALFHVVQLNMARLAH